MCQTNSLVKNFQGAKKKVRQDLIEPAQFKLASSTVIALNADESPGFFMNHPKVNFTLLRDAGLSSCMDDCVHSFGDASILSALDANRETKVLFSKVDQDIITFSCQSKTFCFKRISFVLMTAPVTFRCTLNISVSEFYWKACLLKLDDV